MSKVQRKRSAVGSLDTIHMNPETFQDLCCKTLHDIIFLGSRKDGGTMKHHRISRRDRCKFLENGILNLLHYSDATALALRLMEVQVGERLQRLEESISRVTKTFSDFREVSLGARNAHGDSLEAEAIREESARLQKANADLNNELDQVMRENFHLRSSVAELREDVTSLMSTNSWFRIEIQKDPVDVGEEQRSSRINGSISKDLAIEIFTDPSDTFKRSSSEEESQSEISDEDLIRPKMNRLREEIVSLKSKHEELVKEIVGKDSELVAAEDHLAEIQKELDCNKEECYAHMKVMQQLKNCQRRHQNPNSARKNSPLSQNVLNLQLELVSTKRQLVKAIEDLRYFKEQHQELVDEYERLREDFRYFINKYAAKVQGDTKLLDLPDIESFFV